MSRVTLGEALVEEYGETYLVTADGEEHLDNSKGYCVHCSTECKPRQETCDGCLRFIT